MQTEEKQLNRIMERFGIREMTDVSGRSPAKTYLSEEYAVKTDGPGELMREYEMEKLFYALGMGPEPVAYLREERDFLVTKRAGGSSFLSLAEDPEKLVTLLAEALRALHARSAEGVPVSTRFQRFRDYAGRDCPEGPCDPSVLMQRYMIGSPGEARRIIRENAHLLTCDTLIHGDPCLPNLMQKDGTFVSFIDLSMAGAGDRHIDLYWALWSLAYNLKTDAYADRFLDLYGRENFSEHLLRTIAAFEYVS